jgi:hypothetical protein
MSRLGTAALAGVLIAGATANPALARWKAVGTGTGTVPTSAGTTKVITLTVALAAGKTLKATGTAGITAAYSTAVTVVLCKVNTWTCATGNIAATLNTTAASGSPSYSVTSGNLNGITVWGHAVQTETSGWKDYSSISGSVTP